MANPETRSAVKSPKIWKTRPHIGEDGGQGWPLPRAARAFADAIVAMRRARDPEFNAASHGVSVFKADNGRWPTWAEIGARWPAIGAWMAAQIEGAR